MRKFESGATRDDDEGKYEYGGFLSPLVLQAFGAYMHEHRKLADGTTRASGNWKRGMDQRVYFESLLRHVMDVWLHLEGHSSEAREELQGALCGVLFNTSGLLLEVIREKMKA